MRPFFSKTRTRFLVLGLTALLVVASGLKLYKDSLFSQENISPSPSAIEPTGQQDTAKLYRNEEWGIGFSYPANWEVQENSFGSYYSKFNIIVAPAGERHSFSPVLINIVLPEFAEKSFKNIADSSEVTVGKISGIRYVYEFEESKHIAIVLPLREFRIILATDDERYLDVYNQVIQTFKFLK